MEEDLFDEESNQILSQVVNDFQYNNDFFDIESDLMLSQVDIESLVKKDERYDDCAFSQIANSMAGNINKQINDQRFTVAHDLDVERFQKASTPANTQKNTQWGVNAWDSWGTWRNDKILKEGMKQSAPYSLVPPLTVDLVPAEFNFWICRFIVEVRRQDAQEYPAETLRQLCISIWRYLRDTCRRYDLNMFDRTKSDFADARECLDGRMKSLNAESGYVKKQAEPISTGEEEKLWQRVFSKSDALSVQYAIYFYACKVFGLRAADEHSDLHVENFHFGVDDDGQFLRFIGGKTKNAQRGLKQRNVDVKNIKQYSDPNNPRCVVTLFRQYMDTLPSSGPFYRRPLVPKDGMRRYSTQKVGIHTLQKYMQKMCEAADIAGYKTGHSGKVTTATTLYGDGFDEQLIAERTGHRSNAIRAYTRTLNQQIKQVSNALQPPKPCTVTSESATDDSSQRSLEIVNKVTVYLSALTLKWLVHQMPSMLMSSSSVHLPYLAAWLRIATLSNQDDEVLPNTVFKILENDKNVLFRLRIVEGRGIVFTPQPLEDKQVYKIKVKAKSYDKEERHIQYQTTFMIHISVSAYPY